MDKALEWWHNHEPREQIILAVVGAALVLFLLYFLFISPVQDWHQREQQRLQQAREDVVEVQQLVAKIKARQQSGGDAQANQNLAVVIDSSLKQNELVMRGFTPGANNDARLRLENAPYTALMQWLYDLEYRHGIHIEDLSLTPASAPGYLMVSLHVSQ